MRPAAKKGDHIVAVDTHLCQGAPTPVPFDGVLDTELSPDVLAEHRPVAVVGSIASNTPPHVPPPGKTFDVPPPAARRFSRTTSRSRVTATRRGPAAIRWTCLRARSRRSAP